jgi:hypothetical protein
MKDISTFEEIYALLEQLKEKLDCDDYSELKDFIDVQSEACSKFIELRNEHDNIDWSDQLAFEEWFVLIALDRINEYLR